MNINMMTIFALVERTRSEEYLAFRRQTLFHEGKKPSFEDRKKIRNLRIKHMKIFQ